MLIVIVIISHSDLKLLLLLAFASKSYIDFVNELLCLNVSVKNVVSSFHLLVYVRILTENLIPRLTLSKGSSWLVWEALWWVDLFNFHILLVTHSVSSKGLNLLVRLKHWVWNSSSTFSRNQSILIFILLDSWLSLKKWFWIRIINFLNLKVDLLRSSIDNFNLLSFLSLTIVILSDWGDLKRLMKIFISYFFSNNRFRLSSKRFIAWFVTEDFLRRLLNLIWGFYLLFRIFIFWRHIRRLLLIWFIKSVIGRFFILVFQSFYSISFWDDVDSEFKIVFLKLFWR